MHDDVVVAVVVVLMILVVVDAVVALLMSLVLVMLGMTHMWLCFPIPSKVVLTSRCPVLGTARLALRVRHQASRKTTVCFIPDRYISGKYSTGRFSNLRVLQQPQRPLGWKYFIQH